MPAQTTTKKYRRPTPPPPTPNLPLRGNPAKQGREVNPKQGREVSCGREVSGRAISARNATTHGLFARDVVLPALGEDPAAYEALLEQLCTQLPPRNLLERHYLEQIAAASWRLRRLHRWQAQVYEDDAITEDQRLDKLDKTLRHETTLTRQIDRAVRTLNRDLKWLFESRARQEALYQRDLTEAELREQPELGIEVQRLVWRQLRPTPPPDLGPASLDAQICENEPPPPIIEEPETPPPSPEPPPNPPTRKKCENELTPAQMAADPAAEIAYRKREQEIYRRCHPHAAKPEVDWDSEEIREAYAPPAPTQRRTTPRARSRTRAGHQPFSPSARGKEPDEGG